MTILARLLGLVLALNFLSTVALAHEYKSGNLHIEHPHMTMPLPGVRVSAGYLIISNHGSEADRLVGVSAKFAEKAQLHTVSVVDGVAKMRPVKGGIDLPAGGSIHLKQGGFHLMFLKVSNAVDVGQLQPVKLLFEKAGAIEVELIVLDPADLGHESEGDHSNHGGDNASDHSGHNHSSHGD